MRPLLLITSVAVVLGLGVPAPHAQYATVDAGTLQGVWKVTEASDPNSPAPNRSPQPNLLIYTKTHYSYMAINEPRPPLSRPADPARLTDADKIARFEHWRRITAHSGTYELRDGVLTTRAIVAKNEAVMRGEEKFRVKREGDALLLTQTEWGYTLKLTRLE